MTEDNYARYTRMMVGGAALILVAIAVLHATGYFQVRELVAQPSIPEPWREGIRAVWLAYAAHLFLIAGILAYATARPRAVPGPVLVMCGLVPAIDALLLLTFIGGYLGNGLLGLSAVMVLGAAARGLKPLAPTTA
jgi:hypothetical protein